MRAWTFSRFGPFREVLTLQAGLTAPPPKQGECRLAMRAVALNFPDVLLVEGKYQVKPELPATPGMEGVGVVVEAGPGSRYQVGQRLLVGQLAGVFAEEVTTADGLLFPVPAAMTDAQAAGFHVTYQTSYLGLTLRAGLKAGETLLVHGAAGGVGTAAVQLGKALGARVLATATGPAKCAVALACGAEAAIDLASQDFVAEVKRLTGGRGVDVVYDPVGGDLFDRSQKVMAREARLLVIGFTSGTIPTVAVNRLLLKNLSVVGFQWGTYKFEAPEVVARAHLELGALFEQGSLKPVLDPGQFTFETLPDALAALLSRQAHGKVVVPVDATR
jgi:NADPH2:quinone reductase